MQSYSSWDLKQIGWGGFLKKIYGHHKPAGGALILRLILGTVFLMHGWAKVTAIAGTIKFFALLGLPAFAAYFVGYVEVIGGILLIIGLLNKPAIVALATDMAVVVWGLPSMGHGYFWGHELEFVLLVSLLALYIMGPGKYSVAHLWITRKATKPALEPAKSF